MAKKSSINPAEAVESPTRHRGDAEKSRRGFLKASAGLVVGATATQLFPNQAAAQQNAGDAATLDQLTNADGRPIVLRGGMILSMDAQVGDFEKGDVLIRGKQIVSVGANIQSPADSIVVNADGLIVMPGFIDTHHHQYETIMRSTLADGVILLGLPGPKINYGSLIQAVFTPVYTPDDAHVAELLASLSQINDGVTTTVDTSQVQLTPEHTDACIAGLKESGRRCLFAYGAGGKDAASKSPGELTRLRKQYFSSDDQLLTLGSSGGSMEQWKFARTLNVPMVIHVIGTVAGNLEPFAKAKMMGPDCEYIHCTRLTEQMWKTIADTGGKVSIAPAIEMQMQHGYPPFQRALDHGIRPSLSVDVECNMTADSFSIMRTAFTFQRALANERAIDGEQNAPNMVSCRDVIEFATLDGAKVAHLDQKVGSLTPGKEADIIMLATRRLNAYPLNNVPGTVVTLMDTSNVESVFIAGKVMKWQGKMVGVDMDRVLARAQQACDGVMTRSNFKRDLFGSCCSERIGVAEA